MGTKKIYKLALYPTQSSAVSSASLMFTTTAYQQLISSAYFGLHLELVHPLPQPFEKESRLHKPSRCIFIQKEKGGERWGWQQRFEQTYSCTVCAWASPKRSINWSYIQLNRLHWLALHLHCS